MYNYTKQQSSIETLQEVNRMIEESRNTEKIDIELFKKVYSIFTIFKNNSIVYKNIISIEDPELAAPGYLGGWELFLTSYVLKCKIKTDSSKRRAYVSPSAIWYILATSKFITLNVVDRLFAEVQDYRFKSYTRIWYENFNNKFKEILKEIILLNSYITDEVKLWVKLQ